MKPSSFNEQSKRQPCSLKHSDTQKHHKRLWAVVSVHVHLLTKLYQVVWQGGDDSSYCGLTAESYSVPKALLSVPNTNSQMRVLLNVSMTLVEYEEVLS